MIGHDAAFTRHGQERGGGTVQHEQAYRQRLELEGLDESGSKARSTVGKGRGERGKKFERLGLTLIWGGGTCTSVSGSDPGSSSGSGEGRERGGERERESTVRVQ